MMNLNEIFVSNKKQLKNLLLLSLALIIIDQATKFAAQKYLENSTPIILIPDMLSFHFVRNHILYLHQYIIYFILTIIILPLFILQQISKSASKILIAGLTLLWTAVFSNNIIDAFTLGYIRDFINLHGIAVGNIADQYRTAGLMIVIAGLIIKDEKRINKKTVIKLAIIIVIALILVALFWRYLAKSLAI